MGTAAEYKGGADPEKSETYNAKAESIAVGEVDSVDAAEDFLWEHNFSNEYLHELLEDKEKNRRLVRKIDLVVLPLLAGTYVLQYIDKQAMSYAAVFDLFTSTGVSLGQYSWFASIFYFAYIGAEYPWVYLAQKTRMAKVVAGCVFSWGCVLMITAACSNFGGLAACRFFLGVFEAPTTTCFMMMARSPVECSSFFHTLPPTWSPHTCDLQQSLLASRKDTQNFLFATLRRAAHEIGLF
ncbi:major facilitator superfamily transporter [Ilyonectria robusta]